MFLTGTAVEVQPVGMIDKREYPVGPITLQLKADYAARGADHEIRRHRLAGARSPRRAVRVLGRPRGRRAGRPGELGFDAIEVFPPGPDAVDPAELRTLLDDNGLSLAAVGTGAGWVKHKLTLTSPGRDDSRQGGRVRRADDGLRGAVRRAGHHRLDAGPWPTGR